VTPKKGPQCCRDFNLFERITVIAKDLGYT
jgi:hypothetical protein